GPAGQRRRPRRDRDRAWWPAGPTRRRRHRRPALPSPPGGPASRAATRRGDAASAPAPWHKPRRRAAPTPGSARRAHRSAAPPQTPLRERVGALAASAPAAGSRPNLHNARDSAVPNARGGRNLFHDPPPLAPTAGSQSAMVLASYRCQPQAAKRRKYRASQAERDEPPFRHRAEAEPQDPYPAGDRLRLFYGGARFDDDRGG